MASDDENEITNFGCNVSKCEALREMNIRLQNFLGEREEEGTEKPKKVFVFFPLGKSVPLVSFTHWGENLTFVQKSTFVNKLNSTGKLLLK